MTRKVSRPFEVSELSFMQDLDAAKLYLEECLSDGNMELFQAALRDVAKAQGGMTKLARKTKLNRESLYNALSEKGNPQMDTMIKVVTGFGWRFSLENTEAPA